MGELWDNLFNFIGQSPVEAAHMGEHVSVVGQSAALHNQFIVPKSTNNRWQQMTVHWDHVRDNQSSLDFPGNSFQNCL